MKISRIVKLAMSLSLLLSTSLQAQNKSPDLVEKYYGLIKKCETLVGQIGLADKILRDSSVSTTCGFYGTTLAPGWLGSFSTDVFGAAWDKNGILSGAAPYASDQEAGRTLDEAGFSLLKAAHEYVRQEYGIDDPHEINRRILKASKRK